MKNKFVKVLAAVTVSSILTGNIAYAEPLAKKSETVYVIKDGDQVKDQTVSVWINSDKSINVEDKTDLKDIKNLSNDESVEAKNGTINWKSDDKDIYYQGKSDKKLPVDVDVKYMLDGKEISFEDLKGKSGKLKVIIEANNKSFENKVIDGKDKKIYSPYVVATEITFDSDKVKNINAGDGKVIKDGKNQIVSAVLTPGLRDNFSDILDDDKLDKFKDKIEIEMDITDYEPTEVYAVITNDLFQDDKVFDSFDDLSNGVDELRDNADKLVDASGKLSDGSKKLNEGIGKLSDGSEKLASGTNTLEESFGQLSRAFATLPEKIKPIEGAVNQLDQGAGKLNTGVSQYTDGVSQINSNMTNLSQAAKDLQTGASELDAGIDQLNTATSTLREKTSAISSGEAGDIGKLAGSLGELKTGLDEFSKGIDPLASNVAKADTGLKEIYSSSEVLNESINKLEQTAQNAPSLDASIENLNAKANAIETVIINLEAANEDGSMASEIENLRSIQQGLYVEAENLKVNAQVNAGLAVGLGELSAGAKSLSDGIGRASAGIGELNSKLDQSKDQLAEASTKLASGIDQIDEGISNSDIGKLSESIVMLDEATSKIKAGSSKLKAGTVENQAGVEKLATAMNQLDSKSEELKAGSNALSSGLDQFSQRSKALSSLANINETAINPMAKGISDLNQGAMELRNGAVELKNGSDTYVSSFDEFDDGLRRYKNEGIDKITDKAGDLTEVKDILDEMNKQAKDNNSLSGSTEDLETTSRIIEKIK